MRPDHRPRQDPRCLPLTGRGTFRTRATRRSSHTAQIGIVVTELPFTSSAPRRSRADQDARAGAKKARASSDIRTSPTASTACLVIEIRTASTPEAVLEQLHKSGWRLPGDQHGRARRRPARTLGLKDLLRCFVDFRIEGRPATHRVPAGQAQDRLHLVEGLLIAILDIDEVIQLIRSSDDARVRRRRD